MSMEDIMKALMQSAAAQQKPQQSGAGGDAMSQMLGGMLGGGQQPGAAGGDMLSQALGGMLGGSQQGSAGGDMLSQALGGLLGGQQASGGAGTSPLLSGLQQIIGGTPGTGQQLPMGGGNLGMTASNPLMSLLQPVVNQVAAKLGISPQMATIIASIAMHYLVQSHPNTPGASPLNLGSVMQTMAAGRKVSPTALKNSGMVGDVMQATGMNEKEAVRSLHATFGVLAEPVKGAKGPATRKAAAKKR